MPFRPLPRHLSMPSLGGGLPRCGVIEGRDGVPPAWRHLPAKLLNVFATGFMNLYWLIPAVVASLPGGVANAWLFLVKVTG